MSKKVKQHLAEVEKLAKQLDIKLRYEKTAARGGLCHYDGKYQIIIDSKATDEFKLAVIIAAVKGFDLSQIFLTPKLRELLEMES